MKTVIAAACLVAILGACTPSPTQIVMGSNPMTTLTENRVALETLPPEDVTLLVGYVMGRGLDVGLGDLPHATDDISKLSVGETIALARVWGAAVKVKTAELEARTKAEEAAANERKSKAAAVHAEMLEKLNASVKLSQVERLVLPEDSDNGELFPRLALRVTLENKSPRSITQVKGSISFRDAVGDEIGTLSVAFDEELAGGEQRGGLLQVWTVRSSLLSDPLVAISDANEKTWSWSFEPEALAFSDGEVLRLPETSPEE